MVVSEFAGRPNGRMVFKTPRPVDRIVACSKDVDTGGLLIFLVARGTQRGDDPAGMVAQAESAPESDWDGSRASWTWVSSKISSIQLPTFQIFQQPIETKGLTLHL